MTIRLHRGDLPDLSAYKGAVAIDTETMGLDPTATGSASCSSRPATAPPTWCRSRPARRARPISSACSPTQASLKIFHFARFDIGMLAKAFGVMAGPVYCTKIASRLARTYTDKHGLKDLAREVLGVDLSKQQQSVRLGRRCAERRAGRLRRDRRAASACAAGKAGRHAGARGPRRARRGLLPLPARPGAARPGRLGGRGHLLAL